MNTQEGREFSSMAQGQPLHQARPLLVSHVDRAWAELFTKLAAAQLALPVDVAGQRWTWRPQCVPHAEATHWVCTLHGTVGTGGAGAGQPFICWLDSLAPLAVPPLVAAEQGDLSLLPEVLLGAVLQEVAEDLFSQLGAVLGQQVMLTSCRCAAVEALDMEQGLAFVLESGEDPEDPGDPEDAPGGMPASVRGPVHGILAAEWPHPLLAALLTVARETIADLPPAQAPPWPLPCAVCWSTRPLLLSDIKALELGDVLLIPPHVAGPVDDTSDISGLPVHMQAGDTYFAARWNAAQHSILLESCMQTIMTENETDQGISGETGAGEAAQPVGLSQSRLPIVCRVGEVRLSLEELTNLAPGAVLPLESRTDMPVSLWLGSTRIGQGELVDIDGRLGVRITEMLR